jgi:hypothetical protein
MKKFLEKTIVFQERSLEHANISNQYLEIYLTVKKLKLYMGDHHSFHLIRRCTNLFCNVQQTNIWILILHSVLYWLFTIIFIYIQIENVIWILLFTLRFLINVLYYVYTWLFYLKCQPPQRLSWSWLYGSWIYNSMQSVPIATSVMSSNPTQTRCTEYNIMC